MPVGDLEYINEIQSTIVTSSNFSFYPKDNMHTDNPVEELFWDATIGSKIMNYENINQEFNSEVILILYGPEGDEIFEARGGVGMDRVFRPVESIFWPENIPIGILKASLTSTGYESNGDLKRVLININFKKDTSLTAIPKNENPKNTSTKPNEKTKMTPRSGGSNTNWFLYSLFCFLIFIVLYKNKRLYFVIFLLLPVILSSIQFDTLAQSQIIIGTGKDTITTSFGNPYCTQKTFSDGDRFSCKLPIKNSSTLPKRETIFMYSDQFLTSAGRSKPCRPYSTQEYICEDIISSVSDPAKIGTEFQLKIGASGSYDDTGYASDKPVKYEFIGKQTAKLTYVNPIKSSGSFSIVSEGSIPTSKSLTNEKIKLNHFTFGAEISKNALYKVEISDAFNGNLLESIKLNPVLSPGSSTTKTMSTDYTFKSDGFYKLRLCKILNNLCSQINKDVLHTVTKDFTLTSLTSGNDLKGDRINLVFICNNSYLSTNDCKNAILDPMGLSGNPHFQGSDGTVDSKPSNSYSMMYYGMFAHEPIKSNRNKFNLWITTEVTSNVNLNMMNKKSKDFGINPSHSVYINYIATNGRSYAYIPSYAQDININKSKFASNTSFINLFTGSNNIMKASTGYVLTHELGHGLFGLSDEYSNGLKDPIIREPNCISSIAAAESYWKQLNGGVSPIGSTDPEFDRFMNDAKTYVPTQLGSFINKERTNYETKVVQGGCGSPIEAKSNVYRPSVISLMRQSTPVWGLVNKQRVNNVLSLFKGVPQEVVIKNPPITTTGCGNGAKNLPDCDYWGEYPNATCPVKDDGYYTSFNPIVGFCADKDFVYGQFPKGLLATCASKFPSNSSCKNTYSMEFDDFRSSFYKIPYNIFNSLKGSVSCPLGTQIITSISSKYCVEQDSIRPTDITKTFVFGPFDKSIVTKCLNVAKGGNACYSQKYSLTLFNKSK
ncbi:MAG: hypothetical protein ACRCXZ_10160 [Patescibacteria group bacterium]